MLQTLDSVRAVPTRSPDNMTRLSEHSASRLLGSPREHWGIKVDNKYFAGFHEGIGNDKPILTGNNKRAHFFFDRAEANKVLSGVRSHHPTAYIAAFEVQILEVA